MDHRFLALTLAIAAFSVKPALAGYAQAVPPSGWSTGGSSAGTGGTFNASAANAATFSNGTVRTNAALNVGGRAVSLPATMRFAANAPRIAAAFVMTNPYVRTGVAVAGWLGLAGLVYDATSGLWSRPSDDAEPSTGYEYQTNGAAWSPSPSASCSSGMALANSRITDGWYLSSPSVVPSGSPSGFSCKVLQHRPDGAVYAETGWQIDHRTSSCPSGWYVTDAGCVQTPPPKTVTPEEAVEEIIKHPMPDAVPREIPAPLPVDVPEILPLFIPTGDPVPNPSFDPGKAPSPSNPPSTQPGVDVKPAPTPSSPWQVGLTPVNRPVTDPNAPPVRDPEPLPDGEPNPPKDPDKTDFCEKYPTILACQELKHEEDDIKLPTKAIEFEFNPIPGFQGSKTCPAFPNVGNLLGGKQISWQPFCDSLAKISNLLLAFAWASAAFIMLGYGRSD